MRSARRKNFYITPLISRINYTKRKASKINVDAFLYDEITVLSKIKISIVRHKKRGQLSHAYQSFYFFLI